MNALPLQERNAFEKVKKIIKKEKEDLTRIKTNNNSFYKVINNLTSFKDKINTIVEDYKEALGKSIQYSAEQYMIHNATKYLIDWVGRKFAKSENMPEAWEIYKVASPNYKYNPKYLQKNAYIYNSIQDINNQKLEKDIRERLSLETRKQDCKVVIFKPDSSLAQAVMRDRDFLSFLLNNLNELKKKKTLPDQKIEFTSGDMYNVFHGALIKNIQLHDNGSITMRIEDLYNFNPNRTSARGRIGERLQNEGKLINFYIIVLIEIKK